MNKGFAGFPAGQIRSTSIPSSFFSDLLPAIDHLGELKVTLYALWSHSRSEAEFPYLTRQQMIEDRLLMEGFDRSPSSAEEILDDSLERSVARGSLLKASLELEQGSQELYFFNDPQGQAALSALENGSWRPSGEPEAPVELRIERPNIFNLYEQNIGPLTPRIAVENNVRKWRYAEAILEDWLTSGKREREDRGDTEKARRRYRQGEFADFFDS